ncbi:MAG TPA: N-acetylmuramoyl-L-alanine amidase [Selenomonadales bacterium]|nr:N-acetylmuramoyl-L-alanine amidase [Selenomonadales bacterium]
MPRICIDPGHGGSDPGACGNGLRECDVALVVSNKVRGYLEAVGYEVVMTRETDVDVAYRGASATAELQARCDISDRFGADVFISIHCNAAGNPAALGAETYCYAASTNGRRLARCIQAQLAGLSMVDRGVKDNPLYVTGHAAAVAALAELGFISNPDDAVKLGDPRWRDEFARALARGVTDYFAGVGV